MSSKSSTQPSEVHGQLNTRDTERSGWPYVQRPDHSMIFGRSTGSTRFSDFFLSRIMMSLSVTVVLSDLGPSIAIPLSRPKPLDRIFSRRSADD